jgi:hypothetical protein
VEAETGLTAQFGRGHLKMADYEPDLQGTLQDPSAPKDELPATMEAAPVVSASAHNALRRT